MSPFLRKALRYIAPFVKETKPVNYSAVFVKNGGSSFGSLISSPDVRTIIENKQTLQILASNTCKEPPTLTNTSASYLKNEDLSLISAISSAGIDGVVKNKQIIQDLKSYCCKERQDTVLNGSKLLKKHGTVSPNIRYFETSTSNTIRPIKKSASPLGDFTGTSDIRPTMQYNQIPRRYASYGCEGRDRNPCKKPPTSRAGGIGCLVGPSGVHPAVEGGYKLWRNISLFVCLPFVILWSYTVFTTFEEPKRPEFRKYNHMRIRTKKFPWCGGTDRSFFHNPHLNALPDGYEENEEDE